MSKSSAELNLEKRSELFKALGHPARLMMLNLIRQKPRHGEELALILSLNPATISHHLTKLVAAGLLETRKNQYYQTYSLIPAPLQQTLAELIEIQPEGLEAQVEVDAFRDKVLQTFFRRGRLTRLPAQLKKQQVVLAHIVEAFEPERQYPEAEVNQILLEFHDDVAALRRGLISTGLMRRVRGIYQRIPPGGE